MICLNDKKYLELWEKGKKASIDECEKYYPHYLKIIKAVIETAENYIKNDDFKSLHNFNCNLLWGLSDIIETEIFSGLQSKTFRSPIKIHKILSDVPGEYINDGFRGGN